MTKYTCEIHGDQGNNVGVEVSIREDEGWPIAPGLRPYLGTRRYCMACWIDWMDRNMRQLEQVE